MGIESFCTTLENLEPGPGIKPVPGRSGPGLVPGLGPGWVGILGTRPNPSHTLVS